MSCAMSAAFLIFSWLLQVRGACAVGFRIWRAFVSVTARGG